MNKVVSAKILHKTVSEEWLATIEVKWDQCVSDRARSRTVNKLIRQLEIERPSVQVRHDIVFGHSYITCKRRTDAAELYLSLLGI